MHLKLEVRNWWSGHMYICTDMRYAQSHTAMCMFLADQTNLLMILCTYCSYIIHCVRVFAEVWLQYENWVYVQEYNYIPYLSINILKLTWHLAWFLMLRSLAKVYLCPLCGPASLLPNNLFLLLSSVFKCGCFAFSVLCACGPIPLLSSIKKISFIYTQEHI